MIRARIGGTHGWTIAGREDAQTTLLLGLIWVRSTSDDDGNEDKASPLKDMVATTTTMRIEGKVILGQRWNVFCGQCQLVCLLVSRQYC